MSNQLKQLEPDNSVHDILVSGHQGPLGAAHMRRAGFSEAQIQGYDDPSYETHSVGDSLRLRQLPRSEFRGTPEESRNRRREEYPDVACSELAMCDTMSAGSTILEALGTLLGAS